MTFSRAGVGRRREPAERELTQRRLISVAEQLEDVHALGEIVVRVRRSARTLVNRTANAQEFAPVCRGCSRIEARLAGLDARFRVGDAVSGDKRFACRKIRL